MDATGPTWEHVEQPNVVKNCHFRYMGQGQQLGANAAAAAAAAHTQSSCTASPGRTAHRAMPRWPHDPDHPHTGTSSGGELWMQGPQFQQPSWTTDASNLKLTRTGCNANSDLFFWWLPDQSQLRASARVAFFSLFLERSFSSRPSQPQIRLVLCREVWEKGLGRRCRASWAKSQARG